MGRVWPLHTLIVPRKKKKRGWTLVGIQYRVLISKLPWNNNMSFWAQDKTDIRQSVGAPRLAGEQRRIGAKL